jgi:hypothetical protein
VSSLTARPSSTSHRDRRATSSSSRSGWLPCLRSTRRFARAGWGYTKAREVARIATPETDAAWTTRAQETTNRALERQVAAAQRGDDPPADPDAEPGPARVRVTVAMSAAEADVLATAFARLRLDGGFGTDVENGTLLAEMARRTLAVLDAEAAGDASHRRGSPHRRAIPRDAAPLPGLRKDTRG